MTGTSIVWILNACGLNADTITGGPVRFHEISRGWERIGTWQQTLVTTSGGEGMLRRMGCTLPAQRVRASLFGRRGRGRAQYLWSYLISSLHAPRVVRRLPRADLVITVSDYFCDIVPALAAKRRHPGCRWLAWVHHRERPPAERPGNRLVNELTWRMQEWSLKRIARHADEVWMYDTDAGDQVRARLRELGMPESRMRFMLCGIDDELVRRAPDVAKTVDAVMVGVRPNKGMHDIVPIWQEVQRLRPGTTLRLMGGMSGAQPVFDEIRRCGLDRVIEVFRAPGGFLEAEAYYAKLKEARVLFAPSHEEGWGIILCEAMACRMPAVAYDLPVYRRIYGGAFETVACFDHAAFAARLVGVLNDSAQFQHWVQVGQRQAERFAWGAIVRADEAAATALLQRSGDSGESQKAERPIAAG